MSAKNDSSKNMTPKDLAAELHCDAKTLRRVMRSLASETPGSGARWEITPEFADVIRERMNRTHNRKVVTFTPKG
jgi:hypothetical protein